VVDVVQYFSGDRNFNINFVTIGSILNMALIEISNLNAAGSDSFAETDSFLTELETTDTTQIFAGRGGGGGERSKRGERGERDERGERGKRGNCNTSNSGK
jgi:hypothetical protein